jgi:hypothetical protein
MMYPVATMDWLYPLSGFVVGAIVGLTGWHRDPLQEG